MKKLILLHGAIGSQAELKVMEELFSENFEVHNLNFPGHGSDPGINAGFSIEHFGDAVENYIRNTFKEPVSVFGYSLGGYTALSMALRSPELIDRVFTFATIFKWDPEQAQKQSAFLNAEKIEAKVPAFAAKLKETHGTKWKDVLTKTQGLLTALGDQPILTPEVLKTIGHKTCISVGDRDTIVSLEESIQAFQTLPEAELLVMPHTPHPFDKAPHHELAAIATKFFL